MATRRHTGNPGATVSDAINVAPRPCSSSPVSCFCAPASIADAAMRKARVGQFDDGSLNFPPISGYSSAATSATPRLKPRLGAPSG
ncbi:MAG: hypothetical protein ABIR59_07370 [Gemmatimonadales bacterium]